jgi:deazaflavin-dependent oxidoreductase (nitroreductase family)
MSARVYVLTPLRKLVNSMIGGLIRLGIGLPHTYLLTVHGRKTGTAYTKPVTLVEEDGQRWLVAPYGEVAWVKNARASGQVILTRSGKTETLGIRELALDESAPILKSYLRISPTVLPYFDAKPDSPVEEFAAEAGRHPVFLLTDK